VKDERWRQISMIFKSALERAPAERGAYLRAACERDETLRHEVESLLAAYEQGGQLIDSPAIEAAAPLLAGEGEKLTEGQSLLHYRAVKQIGAGGMGEVYLALDTRLGRKVALKLLPSYFTRDENRLRRFRQEACAASALNHPNIITVYEIGEADGRHFIATELIEGVTLRERMKSGRIKLTDALDITVQAASALTAAHAAGIVHRDIKPENIMLRTDGYVKVLDFGLAKTTERRAAPSDSNVDTQMLINTNPGVVMGTITYMSPEQARGLEVDERTDIWSMGCVVYEMVAGCLPFDGGTTGEVAAAILGDEEPAPLARYSRDVPAELERIVSKALCKEREERYQTAKDFLIDIRNLKQELEFETKLQRKEAHRSASRDSLTQQSIETVIEEEPPPAAHKGESASRAPHALEENLTQRISPGTTEEAQKRETTEIRGIDSPATRWRPGAAARALLAAFAVLLVAGGALWLYLRSANLKWARQSVPRVEELARAQKYFEAYDLAVKVQKYLPDDPTITRLLPVIADDLTVATEPAGARVYLKRFSTDASGKPSSAQLVGTTPINHERIARGDYILSIEKEGYAGIERTVSGAMLRAGNATITPPPIKLEVKLIEAASVPERMAFVPGGEYRLTGWSRVTSERVQLDDYFIDKYEVTNQEYKEFINAGGYRNKQFWKYPFVKEGKTLSWEEAMQEFKDHTGLPGPRTWSSQNYPDGKAQFPVTDISWYEAAAYAAFRGKQLPTVFQWDKAARNGIISPFGIVMPWGIFNSGETVEGRANFGGNGPMAVNMLEFGMSPYGCYHMAGNVAEWCLNEQTQGFTTIGGSWGDPVYMFGNWGDYPGFYQSSKLGFRCVRNPERASGDQGAMRVRSDAEIPTYEVTSEASFNRLASYYRYEKRPLDAQVIEVTETDEWRREKISFVGADGERAIAYLYLPRNLPGPLQVVHLVPPSDVSDGLRSLPDAMETILPAIIKSGRAGFGVALKGYAERKYPPNFVRPAYNRVEFRELMVNWITDLRRGLDYLETRDDIDARKVTLFGPSGGSFLGLIVTAVDTRYRAVAMMGAGIRKAEMRFIPEANRINFIPHIRAPKLMINGRYDETHPFKTDAEPLYKLLREPKRLVVFDSGHIPPPELFIPIMNKWLDETLGPVSR
jgi:serine/threonine protein kinase/formylglycine-generating enzyme required for sulfatase activity